MEVLAGLPEVARGQTTGSDDLGLLSLFDKSQSGPNPLIDIVSDRVFNRIQGSRILVVDDYALDLERTTKLLVVLEEEANCKVDTLQDSKKALQLVKENISAGTPYDVLVLDLHMRCPDGDLYNGDALLKDLSANLGELLPAVVFYSGSHAGGLQGYTFSEVEKLRRLDENHADDHVDSVLRGVPITLVVKSDGRKELFEAVNQVLRIRHKCDTKQLSNHISKMRVKFYEDNHSLEQIGKFARIVQFQVEALTELLSQIASELPSFPESDIAVAMQELRKRAYRDFSFHSMMGDDPLSRFRRHNLGSFLSSMESKAFRLKGYATPGALAGPFEGLNELPAVLTEQIVAYRERIQSLNTEYHFVHALKSDVEDAFNLDLVLQNWEDQIESKIDNINLEVAKSSSDLQVRGRRHLLDIILTQPIENALKFNDNNLGPVRLSIERRNLSSLPAELKTKAEAIKEVENDTSFAYIKVSDHGPGIPSDQLPHIFERGKS